MAWRKNNPEKQAVIMARSAGKNKRRPYSELSQAKKRASCERSRKYRVKYYERYLVVRLRRKAEKLGLPFDLTEEDVVVPSVCPVLGIPIEKDGRGQRDTAPSVDRTIPGRGYVQGNVAVISMKANRIKNDATLEELRLVVQYMEGLQHGET